MFEGNTAKKILTSILVFNILLFLLTACDCNNDNGTSEPSISQDNSVSDSVDQNCPPPQPTVMNGFSIQAVHNAWVYYKYFAEQPEYREGLYRVREDGSGKATVIDDDTQQLIFDDDWIYYVNLSDENKLYKSRTDGSEKTKISDQEQCTLMDVSDGWVYFQLYININDREFYRIRIDGTEKTMLLVRRGPFFINDGWFYSISKDGNIYKMKADGTNETKIGKIKDTAPTSEEGVSDIYVDDHWIYYLFRKDDSHEINRIRTDGTGRTKICGTFVHSMVVSGDWIYYIYRDDTNFPNYEGDESYTKLYKMRVDGTDKTYLGCIAGSIINIENGWIYFEGGNKSEIINGIKYITQYHYRIRTDGSKTQEILF